MTKSKLTLAMQTFMAATALGLIAFLAQQNKWGMAAFFAVAFVASFLIRRRKSFWGVVGVGFSLLAAMFMFPVFGGLEPNSSGALRAGEWLRPEVVLFFMFLISAIGALAIAIRQARDQ